MNRPDRSLSPVPVGGGVAWLPNELPRAVWVCRQCRQIYPAASVGVLAWLARSHRCTT